MPIGTKITLTLVRAANGAFDRVENISFSEFTHPVGFTTTSNVRKVDIAGTEQDTYVVSTNWASNDLTRPTFGATSAPSSPPASPVNGVSDAIDKVNAAFPGAFI